MSSEDVLKALDEWTQRQATQADELSQRKPVIDGIYTVQAQAYWEGYRAAMRDVQHCFIAMRMK